MNYSREHWQYIYIYIHVHVHVVDKLKCFPTPPLSPSCPAACYDSRNHCVWTTNDDWVDVWDCAGKVRLAVHHLATRLGKSSASELIPELDKEQKTVEGDGNHSMHERTCSRVMHYQP